MKQLIILRGLPGSGKSTYAKSLTTENSILCSADNYFIKLGEGSYLFDRSKLAQAHGECFKTFIEALRTDQPVVILDNTNSRPWEMQAYITAAQAYEYAYDITYLKCSKNTSFKRNIHNVPLKNIERMFENLQKNLPGNWNKQKILETD